MRYTDPAGNAWTGQDAALGVTATAAAGTGVTLTLPASAGNFHFITGIIIQKTAAALLVAAAVPVTVTTTNLPGSPVFDFAADAAAQGTQQTLALTMGNAPIKSSAAGVATTIVCPATTAIVWRVTVFYAAQPL